MQPDFMLSVLNAKTVQQIARATIIHTAKFVSRALPGYDISIVQQNPNFYEFPEKIMEVVHKAQLEYSFA